MLLSSTLPEQHHGLLRTQLQLHRARRGIGPRRKINSRHGHFRKLIVGKFLRSQDVYCTAIAVAGKSTLQPGHDFGAQQNAKENQHRAAPSRPQSHPPAHPTKRLPVLTYRCHGKIVKRFGKLAAALRQQRVSGIDFAGWRIRGAYGFPQRSLTS